MKISSQILLAKDTSATSNMPQILASTCASCSSCPLRKVCIPRDLDERETLQFEKIVTGKRRLARHASVYRSRDKLGMLYVVRYGQFKLIGGDRDEQHVAGFHMAGDLLGLEAIASGVHRFRLMATEDSEVCEIPFAAITEMMNVEPALQRHLLRTMSEALSDEYSRSCTLATTTLDERFASFLLKLGEKYARLGYSERFFRLSMSRSDIGRYLGTSIESVSRLIARFNAQGAALIIGRLVELRDRPYLRALMCGDERALKERGLPHATDVASKAIAAEAYG